MAKRKALTELHVALTASTSKFKASMKSASGSMDRFRSMANQTRSQLGKMRPGFLAVAGAITGAAGAFGALTAKSMGNIDALAKTADKLGISTQALAGLQHAAGQTGVATDTLNMAMQRMTRRVAEAAMGTGEAKGALAELGLDAERLNNMSPDRAFREIAEAMRGVTNPADRVRLAMRLFDSEGVSLVNTLALGADGLDRMAAEADALGLSVSRIDASMVEQANDAFARMQAALTGVFNRMAVDVAPVVLTLTESVKSLGMTAGGALGDSEGRLGMIAGVIGAIVDAVDGVRIMMLRAIRSVLGGLEKVGRLIGLSMEELGFFNQGLDQTIDELMQAEQFSDRIAKNHRKMRAEAEKAAEAASRQVEAMDRQVEAARQFLEVDRERDPLIESMRRAGSLMPPMEMMGPEFPGLGGPPVPDMPDRGGFRIVDNLANLSSGLAATTGRDTTAAVNHLTGEVGRLIGFLREGGVSVALTGVEV